MDSSFTLNTEILKYVVTNNVTELRKCLKKYPEAVTKVLHSNDDRILTVAVEAGADRVFQFLLKEANTPPFALTAELLKSILTYHSESKKLDAFLTPVMREERQRQTYIGDSKLKDAQKETVKQYRVVCIQNEIKTAINNSKPTEACQ